MLGLFKKRGEEVFLPVAGQAVSLDVVPDPVFAGRSVGDGFAVEPADGSFCSPVDGELMLVAKTKHAFAVRTDAGAELLIHIGVDTVKLKGEGFTSHRQAGERVSPGDVVVSCDLATISAQVPSMLTPVLLTNGKDFEMTAPDLSAVTTAVMTVRRK